jgi:hypothetical protein
MRFYNQQDRFYTGIDLHSRSMHLCLLDQSGALLCGSNLPTPDAFLKAIQPFR